MFNDNSLDICFLTETWLRLSDVAKMAEIHERKLELFNKPRRGKGGGVGFLFNPKRIHLVRNDTAKYSSFEVLESLLTTANSTVRLCVVYRSTKTRRKVDYDLTKQSLFLREFDEYLDCLQAKSGKPLICGDFNFHMQLSDKDYFAKQFNTLLMDRGFEQHVNKPTHMLGGCLDLIITSTEPEDSIAVNNIDIVPDTGTTSDHYLVTFTTPVDMVKKVQHPRVEKQFRELAKIDLESFKTDVVAKMPHPTSLTSLDEAIKAYNEVLTNVLDDHAPVKKITVRDRDKPCWWNGTCQEATIAKRRSERMYRKDKSNPELKLEFNEKQVDSAIILERERNRFYTKKLSDSVGDPKSTYKIINSLWDKEHSAGKLPKGLSDQDNATGLKDFFHEKVSKIYTGIEEVRKCNGGSINSQDPVGIEEVPPPETEKASYFKLLLEDDIEKVLRGMGTKSCPLDPIPTWLLKNCLAELLPMITMIVNLSLQTASFPSILKAALVRPLLKKASLDSDVLGNYRPVSNLSFLSKLIEKCSHLQLTEHIAKNNLFPNLQSGYRKGHSCETAVIKIHNDVLMAMDRKSHVILMLIDLSAAFDTINHEYLLRRLQKIYNIDGDVLLWIKSYLSNRTFRVNVNGTYSEEAELLIGVPQGSILGPLLFILYTKGLQSLASKYNFSIHLYADDTQIYFEYDPKGDCVPIIEALKKCFSDIKSWMADNYLKMNDSKTEIMEIHSSYTSEPPYDSFELGGCFIDSTDKAKNLGFWFDRDLSLDAQISQVAQTCYVNMRKLRRIGSKLSGDLKVQLVHACIHSILDGCNAAYFSLTKHQLGRLQKIQNSAVRYIFNLKGKERWQSMTPLLQKLHFLPVHYRIRYKLAYLAFKCLNNLAPTYLSSLIAARQETIKDVRSNSDYFLLHQPSEPRCTKTRGAFSYSAPKVWNSLPYSLRSMSEAEAFKRALKTHLFEQAFGG